MSLTISIIFLALGAFITALAFYDSFKKDAGASPFKIILTIAFALFLVFGIWDTFNKSSDADAATRTVTDSVTTSAKLTNKNVDSTGSLITRKIDSTRQVVIDSMAKVNDRTVTVLQKTIREQTRALDSLGRLHAEKHLTSGDKKDILAKIQGIERDRNLKNKQYELTMMGNTNGSRFQVN
jgi:hypothetical protein